MSLPPLQRPFIAPLRVRGIDNVPQHRRKILLEAYTCAPERGSEPGLGWNIVSRLGEEYEVYALVEEVKWRTEIEAYCAAHPEQTEHLHFRFIAKERHRLLRKIWPPSYYWYYRKWQRKALEEARRWDAEEHFDLVHHVTMAGYRAPGYLWQLGKPFVWGPIGGLNNTPWHLLPQLGLKGALFFAARNLINSFEKRWNRNVRRAARAASVILSSTEEGTRDIRRVWKRDAVDFCELGTNDAETEPLLLSHAADEPLRVVWVGLLTARKALPFLLHALPLCRRPIELHIIGEGEEHKGWERIAQQVGAPHRIIFHGLVAHKEVQHLIACSHAACITSVRDDTSTVTLEYLQQGIPVIALAHCGFGTVVNETCGIRIPVGSIHQIECDIANALSTLATDEELRSSLSGGAIKRAGEYAWENKMQSLHSFYQKLIP